MSQVIESFAGHPLSAKKEMIYFVHHAEGLQVEIYTSRLFIRSYASQDLLDCLDLYTSMKNLRYFDYGRPFSEEEVFRLVEEKGERYFKGGRPFGLFSVFEKKSHAFVGQFDFMPTTEQGSFEIGFIVKESMQNRGFCSETMQVFMQQYINKINTNKLFASNNRVREVIATVHPNNFASKRVLEKQGMELVKKLRRFGQPRLLYRYNIGE